MRWLVERWRWVRQRVVRPSVRRKLASTGTGGTGLAVVGIGVGAQGALSTVLIVVGGAFALIGGVGWVRELLSHENPAAEARESAAALPAEERDTDGDDAQLAQECSVLGNAIQEFVMARATQMPPPNGELDTDTGLPPAGSEAFQRAKRMRHDLETRQLYERRFASRVFPLVSALRERGHVQPEDFTALNYPESVADIDWVGTRLEQLGRRLREASPPVQRARGAEPVARRLQEGVDWLRELRRLPAEMAAAMEPEVEGWVQAARDTLRSHPDLLARFNHAISAAQPVLAKSPRVQREGYVSGTARPRLEAILVAGTDCLSDFLARSEGKL